MSSASPVKLVWPTWAIVLAFFLILSATIWIPLVAGLRLCGIRLLADEEPSWFPAEELRDFHSLRTHRVTLLERLLFLRPG
ncbi:SLC6A19 [Cordylochernes scorpioides]|uniref:SLC6A19 n=1 Tax=Cordylochernes scorpioides TaxID=51811 RepID=A0ABY6LSW1_9ARAC|nr:SLC6A19 [Cordylochernes scorpioides]